MIEIKIVEFNEVHMFLCHHCDELALRKVA